VRRHTAAIAGLLLIAAAAPPFVAALAPQIKLAVALVRMPYAQRRARVNGGVWIAAKDARSFPAAQPIPLILRNTRDVDRGVFVTYYLYPRVVRGAIGLEDYRVKGIDPSGRKPVLYVDVGHNDGARILSYAAIRHEQIAEEPAVPTILSQPATHLIVPFATAFDGTPPDAYMTTLSLRAETAATVTLTFEPSGRSMTFNLRRGETKTFRDVVYECFDAFGNGWIRISASVPIRVGAALVNRGRHRLAPMPIVTSVPPLPQRVGTGDRLYLLNASGAVADVVVNGAPIRIPPNALQVAAARSPYDIRGNTAILPFGATKLPDGNTQFVWPESQ